MKYFNSFPMTPEYFISSSKQIIPWRQNTLYEVFLKSANFHLVFVLIDPKSIKSSGKILKIFFLGVAVHRKAQHSGDSGLKISISMRFQWD